MLDLWALLLTRAFKVPATNWAMVGRWFGNMPRGMFAHRSMAEAPPVSGETAIGWAFHYAIGICYGLLLLAVCGWEWFERPTLLPPMILAWVALILPYFAMMPGMGSGVAGARTARPNAARLKSFVTHSVFGVGLYASASVLA